MFKNDVWYKLQIWLNGPCFSDYNMNPITKGRIERAPLSTCSFFFNIVSIIGNSVVLHIFRTKYKKSNLPILCITIGFIWLWNCNCFCDERTIPNTTRVPRWNNDHVPDIKLRRTFCWHGNSIHDTFYSCGTLQENMHPISNSIHHCTVWQILYICNCYQCHFEYSLNFYFRKKRFYHRKFERYQMRRLEEVWWNHIPDSIFWIIEHSVYCCCHLYHSHTVEHQSSYLSQISTKEENEFTGIH